MFRVHMLPAHHGDCLWVEYGQSGAPHRVLIDGGLLPTYPVLKAKLESVPEDERHFELMVVTHVDADHIEAMVSLLADKALHFTCGDFWFNGWEQLAGAHVDFGGLQGEYLSALIAERSLPWNRHFDGGAVVVHEGGPLPAIELAGGLKLTLLSPERPQLNLLAAAWKKECKAAGLVPGQPRAALEHLSDRGKRLLPSFGLDTEPDVEKWARVPFQKDTSPANASSIAFLAEFAGHRVLFGADAYSDVLESNIARLARERGEARLELDAFKLPHHGSAANLTASLLEQVHARRILVSTNGAHFGHPDPEALARVVKSQKGMELVFNYRTEENAIWDNADWQKRYSYRASYPADNTLGSTLEF